MNLALIGVGLIGGSLAAALRAADAVDQVTGFDIDVRAVTIGLARGVIDRAADSPADAVRDAGLVVVATPVGATRVTFLQIAAALPAEAILTDVGSTKCSVIDAARETLGSAVSRFVPAHPIAGGERSGVEHANADLFRDRLVITTPSAATDPAALQQVERLWRNVGARLERLDPQIHDQVFAAVSHLPHLLAFALVEMIAGGPDADVRFAHAGAGFRDFTRIAASSPEMWRDICIANRGPLADELRSFRECLGRLQSAVDRGDGAALLDIFSAAATARRASDGASPES
jgi:prephenate dehydrogenase